MYNKNVWDITVDVVDLDEKATHEWYFRELYIKIILWIFNGCNGIIYYNMHDLPFLKSFHMFKVYKSMNVKYTS